MSAKQVTRLGDGTKLTGGGTSPFTLVPQPDEAFSFLPFDIYDGGDNGFLVTPTFDLQTYAGITVNKTYYVSPSGDNSDGLTWATAYNSLSTALGKSDVDRVYISAGTYGWGQIIMNWNPSRSVEIIGVGGTVYLSTNMQPNYIGSTWTKVDNHYEASFSAAGTPVTAIDLNVHDEFNSPALYDKLTSTEDVDSNAGTFYADTTADKIYVRTLDDREPDSNLLYPYQYTFLSLSNIDVKIYIENLYILGDVKLSGSGSAFYAKNCYLDGYNAKYSQSSKTVYLQDCEIFRTTDDGFRNNAGVLVCINCDIYNCGTGTASNCTSCHGGTAVLINGEYSHSFGRPIHDIFEGKGWYLGVYAHDAGQAGYANFTADDPFETWCDQCISANSDVDYSGNIHKHDCTGDAVDDEGVDTYDY